MRVTLLWLLFVVVYAAPATAQTSTRAWEFGVGTHVALREDATTHNGGGFTIARQAQRVGAVLEASGTRRHGHNDWRVVAGPRVTLGGTGRSAVFAQVLAGTLIRQRAADWAVLPGAGVDVRGSDAIGLRFQIDAPIERSDSRTATSARASVWLIFR